MSRGTGSLARSGRRAEMAVAALAVVVLGMASIAPAAAQSRIENQVAVFAALDKVTARISKLPVPLNETHEFGSLKVTPRVCYSRPPDEQPKTSTFVEVDEVMLNGKQRRIFTGWMFAESPGLNAVEHPVFDVWLTGCEQPIGAAGRQLARDGKGQPVPAKDDEPVRRRVRR